MKILVVTAENDGYPTMHPANCPFAIETYEYGNGHDYDCGIPSAKQYGLECKCESEGECPYLELCKMPLDK